MPEWVLLIDSKAGRWSLLGVVASIDDFLADLGEELLDAVDVFVSGRLHRELAVGQFFL